MEASVSHFRAAIELAPDLSSAWLFLGLAFGNLDQEDDAIDAYQVTHGKLYGTMS